MLLYMAVSGSTAHGAAPATRARSGSPQCHERAMNTMIGPIPMPVLISNYEFHGTGINDFFLWNIGN